MKTNKQRINKILKIILAVIIITLAIVLGLLSGKYPKVGEMVDIAYYTFMTILFIILIIMFVRTILPSKLNKMKIMEKINEQDYQKINDFMAIEAPEGKDFMFSTFIDVYFTCVDIISFNKTVIDNYEHLEFTLEEKEAIIKYRDKKDEVSQEICSYYDSCLEIMEIINKYYDSEGKLKN